jgi:hypothetical protein
MGVTDVMKKDFECRNRMASKNGYHSLLIRRKLAMLEACRVDPIVLIA